MSAIFGGGSEEYLPMSAIYGVRLTFGLDDFKNAFVVSGYGSWQIYQFDAYSDTCQCCWIG